MPKQTTDTTPTQPEPTSDSPKNILSKAVIIVAVLAVLGATGTAGYFYKQLNDVKKNPDKVAQDETKAMLEAVGKLIVLPEGEQPTIATVTEPEKLVDQPFFAKAQKGDKVLIYTNAKKAILYDPESNRIVEVAPINIGDNTATDNSTVSGSATNNEE